MPLPTHLDDLLWPTECPPLTEDWSRDFAPYHFCRIAGFPWGLNQDKELRADFDGKGRLRPFGQKDGEKYLKRPDVLAEATKRLPEAWRTHDEFYHLAGWDRPLGKDQIADAYKGRALAFDRACLVIAAVDVMFERLGFAHKAVLDYVRLAPAIFRLKGFDAAFLAKHFNGTQANRTKFNQLMALTAQTKQEFFDELAAGFGATYATLQKVEHAFAVLEIDFRGAIVPFPERNNDAKAAQYEYAVFPTPPEAVTKA